MTTPNHNTPFQWGSGSRQINTRREFAEAVRDATAICTDKNDSFYPVNYNYYNNRKITGFRIVSAWVPEKRKYGYWWEVQFSKKGVLSQMSISDYWTAKVRLCEYLGCTQKEINDIFWNGKDRSEVGCQGCPCNRVEKGGVRK